MFWFIILQCKVITWILWQVQSTLPKGGNSNAENISAEEAPQKEGAWLQKENVNI